MDPGVRIWLLGSISNEESGTQKKARERYGRFLEAESSGAVIYNLKQVFHARLFGERRDVSSVSVTATKTRGRAGQRELRPLHGRVNNCFLHRFEQRSVREPCDPVQRLRPPLPAAPRCCQCNPLTYFHRRE